MTLKPKAKKKHHRPGNPGEKRGRRGEGHLFRKAGSTVWKWKYSLHGTAHVESMQTEDYEEAKARRDKRIAELRLGLGRRPGEQKVTVAQLYETLRNHNAVNFPDRRSRDLKYYWDNLRPVFAGRDAATVTSAEIVAYALKRKNDGMANATVNRELATLRRMYNVGRDYFPDALSKEKLPTFKLLNEKDNKRTGFVSDDDIAKLLAATDEPWLRTLITIAYTYGWRVGEILGLRVQNVNLSRHKLRLEPGTTKNDEGREVVMTSEVEELVREAVEGKRAEDYVLTRGDNKPIRDFRITWWNLCCSVGLGQKVCPKCEATSKLPKAVGLDTRPRKHALGDDYTCPVCGLENEYLYVGLLVHDLRRSAAKRMMLLGVGERMAMRTGGWKTRAVFERYAIENEADQQFVAEKLARRIGQI